MACGRHCYLRKTWLIQINRVTNIDSHQSLRIDGPSIIQDLKHTLWCTVFDHVSLQTKPSTNIDSSITMDQRPLQCFASTSTRQRTHLFPSGIAVHQPHHNIAALRIRQHHQQHPPPLRCGRRRNGGVDGGVGGGVLRAEVDGLGEGLAEVVAHVQPCC
jgi:hypothetical protein